jgi:hypothetical protein
MITLGTAMMRIIFSSHNAEQNASAKNVNTYSFVVQETGSVSVFNEVLLIAAKIAHGEAGSSALLRVDLKSTYFSFFLSLSSLLRLSYETYL